MGWGCSGNCVHLSGVSLPAVCSKVASGQPAPDVAVPKVHVTREPEEAIALYDLALDVSLCHLCHTLLVKGVTDRPRLEGEGTAGQILYLVMEDWQSFEEHVEWKILFQIFLENLALAAVAQWVRCQPVN